MNLIISMESTKKSFIENSTFPLCLLFSCCSLAFYLVKRYPLIKRLLIYEQVPVGDRKEDVDDDEANCQDVGEDHDKKLYDPCFASKDRHVGDVENVVSEHDETVKKRGEFFRIGSHDEVAHERECHYEPEHHKDDVGQLRDRVEQGFCYDLEIAVVAEQIENFQAKHQDCQRSHDPDVPRNLTIKIYPSTVEMA